MTTADASVDVRYRRPSPIATHAPAPPSPSSSDDLPGFSPTSPTGAALDLAFYPRGARSLAGIALRAFCLGAAVVVGIALVVLLTLLPGGGGTPLWRLPFFLAALATFHFLEFWTTAAYNTPAATVDSFLLTANWPAYAIAHSAASAECLLRLTLGRCLWGGPEWWWWWWWPGRALLLVGLALVAVGQGVRTAAMVQAGRSFNHTVQQRRARSHALVTTGVYARLRHPSYFGFFWWALGTQLVLGNCLCLAAYAAVLWRFFSLRVRHEEALLVRFFGDEYVAYRQRVGTKLPFV